MPLGSMVAGRADACRVRPTYFRTRAKDVVAMFVALFMDAPSKSPLGRTI